MEGMNQHLAQKDHIIAKLSEELNHEKAKQIMMQEELLGFKNLSNSLQRQLADKDKELKMRMANYMVDQKQSVIKFLDESLNIIHAMYEQQYGRGAVRQKNAKAGKENEYEFAENLVNKILKSRPLDSFSLNKEENQSGDGESVPETSSGMVNMALIKKKLLTELPSKIKDEIFYSWNALDIEIIESECPPPTNMENDNYGEMCLDQELASVKDCTKNFSEFPSSSKEDGVGLGPESSENNPPQEDLTSRPFHELLQDISESFTTLQQTHPENGGKKRKLMPFRYLECNCLRLQCGTKFPRQKREEIYEKFSQISTWELQGTFIVSHIQKLPVARRRSLHEDAKFLKSVSRKYFLNQTQICRPVFAATLGIGQSKIDYLISSKESSLGIVTQDRRGRHTPANKTPVEVSDKIRSFLEGVPKCSLNGQSYFSPDLTVKKLYDMYVESVRDRNPECIKSLSYFRSVFKSYNVQFYKATDAYA